jgi:cytochrome c551/c552
MKRFLFLPLVAAILVYGCGGGDASSENGEAPKSMLAEPKADDGKGVGEITHVDLNDPLNAAMVEAGKGIFEMKCSACHKLSDQRVVGPGFKGITERRKPEWIMNMITNVDIMLDADPTAQALLKECLVRMPNQNLTIDDARAVLEYAYANDGYPVGK